jgi:2-keto-4-pentenoate hydratase/2-oxohepta-3-ene-1,7-dioic acid hydratase in catechol pathway
MNRLENPIGVRESPCALALVFALVLSGSVSRALEIAPPAEALTFARVGAGVVLVTEYEGGIVRGVNLSCVLGRAVSDPIEVFLAEGYRRLHQLAASRKCAIVSRVSDLSLPVPLGGRHIAVGTNFPEHAGESEVEGGPFLFAKLVEPTPFNAAVAVGEALLDYEVELAWVTLEPLRTGGPSPKWMGLILCNDYTDRDLLLRSIDVSDVESGEGFTTGKSAPGYLPVGDLFVIPADYRGFAAGLELRLDVNGKTRQRASVSEAIWDIDELIEQVWLWQDRRWDYHGEPISLLVEPDVVSARTMLMGGTPSGTAFQGVPLGIRVSGVAAWLFGGWDRSIVENVADAYAATAREEERFLQAGDRVSIRVEKMGQIDNRIED